MPLLLKLRPVCTLLTCGSGLVGDAGTGFWKAPSLLPALSKSILAHVSHATQPPSRQCCGFSRGKHHSAQPDFHFLPWVDSSGGGGGVESADSDDAGDPDDAALNRDLPPFEPFEEPGSGAGSAPSPDIALSLEIPERFRGCPAAVCGCNTGDWGDCTSQKLHPEHLQVAQCFALNLAEHHVPHFTVFGSPGA